MSRKMYTASWWWRMVCGGLFAACGVLWLVGHAWQVVSDKWRALHGSVSRREDIVLTPKTPARGTRPG